jgi:hypothetical protein
VIREESGTGRKMRKDEKRYEVKARVTGRGKWDEVRWCDKWKRK